VPELASALAAVVVVEEKDLDAVAASLPAGATAVTLSGMFARWDGLRGRAASNSVEAGLRRMARIRDLRAEILAVEPEIAACDASRVDLEQKMAEARRLEGEARTAARSLAEAVRTAREALTRAQVAGEQGRRVVAVAEAEVSG